MEDNSIDVNMYLDELKSEDPSLKLNAVSRLPLIADCLSSRRIEQELIPYLAFITTEMDTEDEFLISLSSTLQLYLEKREGIELNSSLIYWEPLCSLNNAQIRDICVKSILNIFRKERKEMTELLLRFFSYSRETKIVACELAARLLEESVLDQNEAILLEKMLLRCFEEEGDFLRRKTLRAFSEIWRNKETKAQRVLEEEFLKKIISLFIQNQSELILYEIVNVSFIDSLLTVLGSSQIKEVSNRIIGFLKVENVSLRILYLVYEVLPLFHVVENWSKQVLEWFFESFKSIHTDCTPVALKSISMLCSKSEDKELIETFMNRIETFLLPIIKQNSNQSIKLALIKTLQHLQLNCTIDNQTDRILAVVEQLMNENDMEICLESVKIFGFLLKTDHIDKIPKILENSLKFQKSKFWHVRSNLIQIAQEVIKFHQERKNWQHTKLIFNEFSALSEDSVVLIRHQFFELVLGYCRDRAIGMEERLEVIGKVLESWVLKKSFLWRISGFKELRSISDELSTEFQEKLINKLYLLNMDEKVINVRIAMISFLLSVRMKFADSPLMDLLNELKDLWIDVDDTDLAELIEQI